MLRVFKGLMIFSLFLMAGCSSDSTNNVDSTWSEQAKKKSGLEQIKEIERKALPLQFGDLTSLAKGQLENVRKHFDTHEKISYKIQSVKPFGTDALVVRLLRVKGTFHRIVKTWEERVRPSHTWCVRRIYNPSLDGELEPGEYKVRVYRGLELLATDTFYVVKGIAQANEKQRNLQIPGSVGVTFEDDQVKITVPEPLIFGFNQSVLKPEAKKTLDEIVEKILRQYPKSIVKIHGHTDNLGSESYNLALSEKRAQAVRDYLATKNLPGVQYEIKGYGESQPKASNDTVQGRQANRRVEIVVIPRAE